MSLLPQLLRILDDTLALQGRALGFDANTRLLDALPELDSMAVMALLAALENELGITIDFGDLDGEAFATVGTLLEHVSRLR